MSTKGVTHHRLPNDSTQATWRMRNATGSCHSDYLHQFFYDRIKGRSTDKNKLKALSQLLAFNFKWQLGRVKILCMSWNSVYFEEFHTRISVLNFL